MAESQNYRAEKPIQEANICSEMAEMDKCLENVHLYENHSEEDHEGSVANGLKDFEEEHRIQLEKHHRPIPPCHERGEVGFTGCPASNRKAVTFNDSAKYS